MSKENGGEKPMPGIQIMTSVEDGYVVLGIAVPLSPAQAVDLARKLATNAKRAASKQSGLVVATQMPRKAQ